MVSQEDTNHYKSIELISGSDHREIQYFDRNGVQVRREFFDTTGNISLVNHAQYDSQRRLISCCNINAKGDTTLDMKYSYYDGGRLELWQDEHVVYFIIRDSLRRTINKIGRAREGYLLEMVLKQYDDERGMIFTKDIGRSKTAAILNSHNLPEQENITYIDGPGEIYGHPAGTSETFSYTYEYNEKGDWIKETKTLTGGTETKDTIPPQWITERKIEYYQ